MSFQPAIYVIAEPTPENPKPPHAEVTYAQLYALVADAVSALLQHSLQAGDRVASYSSNCIVRPTPILHYDDL